MAGGSRRRVRRSVANASNRLQESVGNLPAPPPQRRRRFVPSNAIGINPDATPLVLEPVDEVINLPTQVEPDYVHVCTPKKRPVNRDSWKSRQLHLIRRDYRPCGCTRLACDEKLCPDQVERLRSHLFGLRAYNDQQAVLFRLLERVEKKRPNGNDESRRQCSFKYFFPNEDGTLTQVCKLQFLNLFSMNRARLLKLQKEKRDGLLSPKGDTRGKHDVRPNKVSSDVVMKMIEFIIEILKAQGSRSHFSRGKHAVGTIFLPHTLSIRHLHKAFLLQEQPEYISQVLRFHQFESDAITLRPLVTLDWFRTTFNKYFGKVKFRLPKTDECGTCLTLRNKIEMVEQENPNDPALPFVRFFHHCRYILIGAELFHSFCVIA